MKFLKVLLAILVFNGIAIAQFTTTSATVTDPDAFNWAGGTIQFALYNNQGGTVTYNGVPLTSAQLNVVFNLNSGGAFSGSLNDNTLLKPVGTQWDVTVCPQASAPCQQMARVTISGATQSLTSTINGQLKALRFPASYQARAYGQVEISPIPPAGGTYYDITLISPRFWTGTAWQTYGTGSGGSAHAPDGSIQVASGANFTSDANFLIDLATHTRSSAANDVVNAVTSIPRAVYDPMDTKFLGGLAAAIAGTSGHTPTEVINATIDYAFCQTKTTGAKAGWIITPPQGILIDGVKLWGSQRFGSESMATQTFFGHSPVTQPMISFHGGSDTITCNGTPYTPGLPVNTEISFIAISGAFTGAQDFGIDTLGFSTYLHDIQGWGVAFAQQAIWMQGTSSYGSRLGLPGSQIQGCQDFINGVDTGTCYSVQLDNLDGNADYIYASDGASNLTGKGPGPCYPNCGAIGLNGDGSTASFLFPQLSDVGIKVNATAVRGGHWRTDATSMEGVRFDQFAGSAGLNDIKVTSPCLSKALQTAYDAGTATGCKGVYYAGAAGRANVVTNIAAGGLAFFGDSYMQCAVGDDSNSGAGASNLWGLVTFQGSPGNTTANDWALCGSNSAASSMRALFPNAGTPIFANTASINISGITALWIANGLTVTNFVGGVAGQHVDISAAPGSTANIDITGNFKPCNGLITSLTINHAINTIFNTSTGNLEMVCNPPDQTPTHVNYASNPTPSDSSLLDVYGDVQARLVPAFTNSAGQLHAPSTAPSGQYCFEQENIYQDGSHNVTPLFCTNADLTIQTAGEIFVASAPQVVTFNLYLVSNTTGSGIPTGKYPAPSGGIWDGPTTIAAGGNSAPSPAASENTTGSAYLGFEIKGPATAPSGTCTPFQAGLVVSLDQHGTTCPVGGGTWTSKW